jgi:phosphatidylglycerophosphate synthase
MSLATPLRFRPRDAASGAAGPERDLALGAFPLLLLVGISCWSLGVPASRAALAVLLYGVMAVLVLRCLPYDQPGPGVGPANRVTLGRAILVAPVVAIATTTSPLPATGYWWVLLLALAATVLDGVDGRIARRTRTEGALGARFDMEVDAALILALSSVAWQTGKMGPWVLLIGAIRYLFVVGGALWPTLRYPLPPRWRRKAICVVQSVTLIVCVAPIVPPGFAAPAAAAALLLLAYSFAVDVSWLIAFGRPSRPAAASVTGA